MIFSVKTTIYTLALIMALCCGSSAVAQNANNKPMKQCKSCPDSVLISKRIDGNYEIRQYIVNGNNPKEADYSVHFPISSSQMSQTFSNNASDIRSLKNFVAKFHNDSLMHIKMVKIKGWASPDGVEASNSKLAKQRGATFIAYLRSQCPEMKNVDVESSSAVATWKDCLPMLERSSVANCAEAADIIKTNRSESAKEANLAKMPAVWSYLKNHVLPEFRCAEVEIVYTNSDIVETRDRIQRPAPATPAPSASAAKPAPVAYNQNAPRNQPVVVEKQIEYIIIEDKRNGVIIEMDDSDVDWD